MLTIENLTHVYGNGTRALDDVSLTIPKGMFGLLGPNGAGKSTLMRSIATLQTPTSGSIRFGDIDVIRDPEQLRRVLGYLPQDFGVYPRVSAYDMLDHMAVLKGISGRKERKATVEALLNQVNLWPVRGKALAGFSGGMRQRFGIAQALGFADDVDVAEADAAFGRRLQRGDSAHQRRLAGAVGAQQAEHPLGNGQADVVQRPRAVAVDVRQVFDSKHESPASLASCTGPELPAS